MNNQITDPPLKSDFGLDFDYAVWTPDTRITLTNVPWNNDYRDVVSFETTAALNEYIDSSAGANLTVTNSRHSPIHAPITLEYPFNVVNRYNYVRVYNPAQPIKGGDTPKYFYYFITDVRYGSPNATIITVQLDVWQTFIRQVQLGRCYVERGHLGIANTDQFRNYGRDFLTVPEGLDTGSDYQMVTYRSDDQIILPAQGRYSILVCSTVKLEAAAGNVGNPNLQSAEGGRFQGLPAGASYYIFTSAADFETFMRNYSGVPWVTQGIISITVIPPITRYYSMADLGARLSIGAYKAPAVAAYAMQGNRPLFVNWRDNTEIRNYIPSRFRSLKKFWTFPYMVIELTTMLGQSVILKPELWNSPDAWIREEVSLLPPNQRLSWMPAGYNYRGVTSADSGESGDGYMYSAGIGNFPALAIVNNGAILAMAANANSIAFGYQSADWSQQRALRANEVGYDQASSAIAANGALTENGLAQSRAALGINQNASGQQLGLNTGSSILGSTAGGAAAGAVVGPGGVVAGAALGAITSSTSALVQGIGHSIESAKNQSLYAAQALGARGADKISGAQAGYIRDTNKSLADFAAKGDYEMQIAGLEARTRDMQLTPPSMAGQVGGEALGMLNFRFGYRLRFLLPDQASMATIGEYWLRYGYAVHRFTFVPNDFMVMDRFTYWKMKETYIRAAGMPESFKQAIRGIFEKGVTVWRRPADIGMIDPAVNKAIPGIKIDGYTPPEWQPEKPEEPETKKKRNKKMLVFSTTDQSTSTPGPVWALAGTSPGTDANWQETRDQSLAQQYMDACQVETSVGISYNDFLEKRDLYRAPLNIIVNEGEIN